MCIMCTHQKPMVQEVSSASPYEQLVSRRAALGHRLREAGRCREAGKGVKRMKKGNKKRKKNSQYYRHCQQKFLCRCVLVTIIDLFPHVQVIVRPRVKLERNALNPVKHKVRALRHPRHTRQYPYSSTKHRRDIAL